MRRPHLTVVLSIALFLSFSINPANAAIKAGATCTKIGSKSIVGNKTFTCIKSGKKLIWNTGVLNKTSKTAQVVYPAAPTDFSNLYANRTGIAYAAWKATSDSILNGTSTLKNVKVLIGPNTIPPIYKTPEIAFGLVSKAFNKYETPKDTVLIEYSLSDISWAENKIRELVTNAEYDQLNRNENGKLVTSHCNATECFGAKQVSVPGVDGVAFILAGVPTSNYIDPVQAPKWNTGQLEAHEFFHAMQRRNVAGFSTKDWAVSWIVEGGAALVQNLVMSSTSHEKYLEWRKIDALRMIGPNSPVTSQFMADFLDLEKNKDYWRSVDNFYAYNLGSRIMEVFVALKGPGVLLDLHKETAVNGFNVAFQNLFGIPWSEASPIINKTIVDSLRSGN